MFCFLELNSQFYKGFVANVLSYSGIGTIEHALKQASVISRIKAWQKLPFSVNWYMYSDCTESKKEKLTPFVEIYTPYSMVLQIIRADILRVA